MVGKKPKYNLSPDKIERLEEIGFQWKCFNDAFKNEAFEKHCRELMAFKEKFGHCYVPSKYLDNPSLGMWCRNMRYSYKRDQEGKKPSCNLSPNRIERLEEIGFQWNCPDWTLNQHVIKMKVL